MKNFIKAVVFVIIFIIIWNNVFSVLWLEKDAIYYFNEESEDSFDIVYIGASNVMWHFNSVLAYSEYGFTTGIYAAERSPLYTYKNIIEEIQTSQTPLVFLIDLSMVYYDLTETTEGELRKTTDNFKYISSKSESVKKGIEYIEDVNDEQTFYLSYLYYHSMWKEIGETNFINKDFYKGYKFNESLSEIYKHSEIYWFDGIVELNSKNEDYLIELLEYLNTQSINVVFTISLRGYSNNEMGQLNYATNIINEYGYEVINFVESEELTSIVDEETDYWNFRHLNSSGATKFTLYFSEYLSDNYDLPDHRGGVLYDSWDSEYERFKKSYYEITGNNFEELVNSCLTLYK